jgi:RNA polymerase subunit RPABC4/transcription elongation factor Spt4
MWQCSNCGERVENDFEVCWNCQTEKRDSITVVEEGPESWECDACGTEVATEDTICPGCGADISEIAGPHILCPKCGARVDDDAEFCSSCAGRISASDILGCRNCGKPVNPKARFCKYCGKDLTHDPNSINRSKVSNAQTVTESTARRSPSSTPANLIFFGIIIAVASAMAYLWGINYAGNFGNAMAAGLGNLVGQRNQTYDMAVMAIQFGPFGFFSGLILFVVGLVLKHR